MSKKKAAAKNVDREAPSFEEALQRADQLVRELEDGTLGLSESLKKYEQGITLLRQCFQMLDAAELKITQLTGFDEQGRPLIVDFDSDQQESLPDKARSRSRRRSAASSPAGARHRNGGAAHEDATSRLPENHHDDDSVDEPRGLF